MEPTTSDTTAEISPDLAAALFFMQAAQNTGGVVQFQPVLIGKDGKPVLLSEVLGAIRRQIDPLDIQREWPGLSLEEIAGAFAFLEALFGSAPASDTAAPRAATDPAARSGRWGEES